ncbi:DUF5696 domain-containing protein [Paenibacillus montanisoli]|uniref:Uncharacterized protein n=1 Tax=Paenibacillus montanisoli TaxID=2081970 RepID=A0A328U1D0_9BACL|nr:DUF5696 domain-containing protein [Paenibacillus montanisoli]RAP73814.1 hypothetical protein DL346_26545 [Paenibacillus montanisoli]
MRNYKWLKILLTYGLAAACVAFFFFIYMGGSTKEKDDVASAEQLKAAFSDKPAAQQLSSAYRQVAENDRLILKLKEDTLAIQVTNKQSGYVWSSDIASPETNETWLNFIHSGLSIDYFDKENNNAIRTDLSSQKNKTIDVTPIEQGFQASIRFHDLRIGLDLTVKLEGDQVVVNIPQKSILEGDQFKLGSIIVYPFLGATKGGDINGYMFIPDGSGALIKFADNKGKYKTPYDAKIYGDNKGIDIERIAVIPEDGFLEAYRAQFPVFGLVHGEKQHAVLGMVEKGKYNARILSYPNGVSTPYNWSTAQFIVRESYLQPTSRTMGGIVVFEKTRNQEDMQTRYSFLEGEDASYIGMARTYRGRLIAQGALGAKPAAAGEANIPLHLDVLGAETEGGLFANTILPMTTANQLSSMLDQLSAEGVSRTSVVFKGWSKGGLSGTNPSPVDLEPVLGSASDFAKLQEQIDKTGGKLYYYSDFTTAYDTSKRFQPRSEAATKIDKKLLSMSTDKPVYPSKYYMSANYALKVAEENASDYKASGIEALAVDVTPYELFSERVEGAVSSRSKSAATYHALFDKLKPQLSSMAMYRPNDYMLPYADQLFGVPMESSQYTYTSETVPFEQIVLKGYKNYYAEPINFMANPQKKLLKMIETASYPSYYLTSESPFRLRLTNSSDVYASEFASWKANIVSTYKMLNEALGPVQYATIEDRSLLAKGIVQVTYSNGKAIVVNYNDQAYDGKDVSVPALGFKVIEVKG